MTCIPDGFSVLSFSRTFKAFSKKPCSPRAFPLRNMALKFLSFFARALDPVALVCSWITKFRCTPSLRSPVLVSSFHSSNDRLTCLHKSFPRFRPPKRMSAPFWPSDLLNGPRFSPSLLHRRLVQRVWVPYQYFGARS